MVTNGLTKGLLMLFAAAIMTWVAATVFERRAQEDVSAANTVPPTAHAPDGPKRGPFEWQF